MSRVYFETVEEMRAAGYGKIGMDYSCSHTRATFYNPDTEDCLSMTVSDADDPRNDNWELYRVPINAEYLRISRIRAGIIFEGATVEVFKGWKVPVGTIAVVKKITPWYDRYRRWQCDYAHLSNGTKTNVKNCRLKMEELKR